MAAETAKNNFDQNCATSQSGCSFESSSILKTGSTRHKLSVCTNQKVKSDRPPRDFLWQDVLSVSRAPSRRKSIAPPHRASSGLVFRPLDGGWDCSTTTLKFSHKTPATILWFKSVEQASQRRHIIMKQESTTILHIVGCALFSLSASSSPASFVNGDRGSSARWLMSCRATSCFDLRFIESEFPPLTSASLAEVAAKRTDA